MVSSVSGSGEEAGELETSLSEAREPERPGTLETGNRIITRPDMELLPGGEEDPGDVVTPRYQREAVAGHSG